MSTNQFTCSTVFIHMLLLLVYFVSFYERVQHDTHTNVFVFSRVKDVHERFDLIHHWCHQWIRHTPERAIYLQFKANKINRTHRCQRLHSSSIGVYTYTTMLVKCNIDSCIDMSVHRTCVQ
jgi:hypothetical protein